MEIGARVRAKTICFGAVPEGEVSFEGEGTSQTERENLPKDVEPGVTYRDVRVRWHAAARLDPPQ